MLMCIAASVVQVALALHCETAAADCSTIGMGCCQCSMGNTAVIAGRHTDFHSCCMTAVGALQICPAALWAIATYKAVCHPKGCIDQVGDACW